MTISPIRMRRPHDAVKRAAELLGCSRRSIHKAVVAKGSGVIANRLRLIAEEKRREAADIENLARLFERPAS